MYSTVYMTRNCFSAAMAAIVAEGALTKSQTGLLTSMFYLVYAPLQIPGGMLADRYNPERLIEVGLLGTVLVNTVMFFEHNYYVMLVAWMFNAVIQAPVWSSVFKIISSQLATEDRPIMVFLISIANSFGLVMGYVMAAFIPSWEYNFAVSAAALAVLAVCMHLLCIRYGSYTSSLDMPKQTKNEAVPKSKAPAWRLFAASGFLLLLPAIILRSMVELSTKTFSSTMLMESYAQVSPKIGNLLNVLVLVSGILGTLLIKLVLYPRFIKNELSGMCIMLIAALPFTIVLKLLGVIPVPYVVVALCCITAATTSTHLLLSYYNMSFEPYGRNATAAGLGNAAASIGVVFESYGFARVAESFGWSAVTSLWIIMLVVAVLCIAVAIPLSKRFKRGLAN